MIPNNVPLVIVSGPSGVGKSTVIRSMIAASDDRPWRYAVSATTRECRQGEMDGVHYHFWDRERFEAAVGAGEFLEHAEVHGNLYGTPASEVDPYLIAGTGVILDIDVVGAASVRKLRPAFSVFLKAPDPEDYEKRIRGRGDHDEAVIQRRLRRAAMELERIGEYDEILINREVDETAAQLRRLIEERYGRD